MRSKKQQLKTWKIYAILDDGFFPEVKTLLSKFNTLLESPVDVVQLRFSDFSSGSLLGAARGMVKLAKKKKVPILINDRPEIALLLGADGVHLGKSDLSLDQARALLGPGAIIGRTIRNYKDYTDIDKKLIDYVAIGPVFKTPLKPRIKKCKYPLLKELACKITIPLVAIGGINKDNAASVINKGIKTVAFVRYGITSKDPKKKITDLKRIIEK